MNQFRKAGRGRINQHKPVAFTFDGRSYTGYEGDTLASALLAHGEHLVGRSFKYHRPRGFVGAGFEEPNALVAIDRGVGRMTPNVRATTVELYEGLNASSQNRWPSLKYDAGALNNFLSMFFPAGFYNKTFMWPKSFWDKVYEPAIRRMAGLGPAPEAEDPDHYASCYSHCEILIVGAGPAGIAAALSASDTGAQVTLVDELWELGGSLLSTPNIKIDGKPSQQWLQESLEVLAARENVTLLPRTTVIGYYHDNFLAMVERHTDHLAILDENTPRETLHRVRAEHVILATGAIERPLVFADNDKPGVMLASAAQAYLNRHGVVVGENISIFTSHDSAYQTAFDLADANVKLGAIIDPRPQISAELMQEADRRGIEVLSNSVITQVGGKNRVKNIRISTINMGQVITSKILPCDALLMSGGWTPSVHLFSHSKGSLKWVEEIGAYIPDQPSENCRSVGACNGTFALNEVLQEASEAGGGKKQYQSSGGDLGQGMGFESFPNDRAPSKIKAFVDFQNDVTSKDIGLAVREGFKSIEHVKRYTTNGMATDQGKLSNLNGLQLAAKAVDRPVEQVGLTTFRPPYTPTTFGAMTGYRDKENFDVTRKTPIDAWAEGNGAIYEPVSLWRRAWYFPQDGEDMHAAVARECKATRDSLGIFDASTLGKIEIVGPDAAKFMNLMYTNPWTKLGVGKCRYGVMLGEDGYIRDDGVIGRIADDRFHVTTTTGGAPRVLSMMEDYLQTEFPDLNVWLTSTTEQWAVIAINGPNARKLLEPFVEGIDLSPEAFPHMSLKEGKICGVETRLFRVSFTGELGFEINVPAHYGRYVWERLFDAGKEYNITPYGTETMHVLRAEKGFIIVGQDTDGTVSPHDAGLAWAIGKTKKDFVGKRSLQRPDLVAAGRKHLVGLLTEDPMTVLEEGAQIVMDKYQPLPMKMVGHVTSSYWSSNLSRSIALALVEDGHNLKGEDIFVPMPDKTHTAKIVDMVFYDPKGEKLNVV